MARNTVRAALASDEPPRYERERSGSLVDEFEPQIRVLLAATPSMPASVIGERIGWEQSASVLRARVALLRPLYAPSDPADRTAYRPGDIVQCDLWFPAKVVPVAAEVLIAPPVLTMVAAWSGFIAAVLLPTRQSADLLAGMWQLLAGSFGAVPRMLVWDNEAGIGQHQRLTVGARAFAGTLGTRIWQTRPGTRKRRGGGTGERVLADVVHAGSGVHVTGGLQHPAGRLATARQRAPAPAHGRPTGGSAAC
ncbi:MAG: hypothetical protein IPL36_11480 [Nigerium sp.]|nr:hypothetical protein [Nigerium sp.]